ncbi:MAG: flavodoxin domain-containing protein [Euryarchaeota archaeon]|nr:flavodoxin domain-containing protein [Euryarchaeota archaeon]
MTGNFMRALVAYGTRYGSTKGIAERMGKVLKEKKVEVMIEEAERVSAADIASRDLIVIGSAIIMGNWLRPAEKLIASNETALAGKRTARLRLLHGRLGPVARGRRPDKLS